MSHVCPDCQTTLNPVPGIVGLGSCGNCRCLAFDPASERVTLIRLGGASIEGGPVVHLDAEFSSRFRLVKVIGAGGTGVVFRAQQRGTGRPVALKLLRPGDDPELASRFTREVAALVRLQHPNVVQIHDAGFVDGIPYLALELVVGEDLGRLLARRGPLPFGEAISLAIPCLEALEACHAAGVVHRDIKPGNILVREDGVPKLADFGLVADARSPGTGAGAGVLIGTPEYLPPETIESGQVGPAGDIYAMGLVLHELLTGRHPFRGGDHPEVLARHLWQTPASLRAQVARIPVGLDSLVRRCLSRDPQDRPRGALELARELALTARERPGPPTGTTAATDRLGLDPEPLPPATSPAAAPRGEPTGKLSWRVIALRSAVVCLALGLLAARLSRDPASVIAANRDLGLGFQDADDPKATLPIVLVDFEMLPGAPDPYGIQRPPYREPPEGFTLPFDYRGREVPASREGLVGSDFRDYEMIVRILTALEARLIVFDFVPAFDALGMPGFLGSTRELAGAIKQSGRVMLTATHRSGERLPGTYAAYRGALVPSRSMIEGAAALGEHNTPRMPDGCVRYIEDRVQVEEGTFPDAAVVIAAWLRSAPGTRPVVELPSTLRPPRRYWLNLSRLPRIPRILAGDLMGPTTFSPQGRALIKDKIVIVRSLDTRPYCVTVRPSGPADRAVEVGHSWLLAAAAENLANDRHLVFVTPFDAAWRLALLLVGCLAVLAFRLRHQLPLLLLLAIAGAWIFLQQYRTGLLLDVVNGMALVGALAAAGVGEALVRRAAGAPPSRQQLTQDLELLGGQSTMPGPTTEAGRIAAALRRVQSLLPEHLEIRGTLGGGGMGVVFRADDKRRGHPVAIKVLTQPLQDHAVARRFIGEIRTLEGLDDPGIVRILDAQLGPVPFFVMELVEGQSLQEVIGGKPVVLDRALRLATGIARALAHIHQNRIIHRDIKPSNVMVLAGDRVKLLDFGIAHEEGRSFHTRTGAILGTYPYMAPEQAGGEAVGTSADVYGLGLILAEMLLGWRLVRRGMYHEVPAADLRAMGAPESIEELIAAMLAPDPRSRVPDGARALAELERIGKLHAGAARRV